MTPGKADSQKLLNALLPFAKQMLEERGAFFPFGGRMAPDGTIEDVAATDGTEHPRSQLLIELMQDAFRDQARTATLRASGILFDVRIVPPRRTEKQDAIAAALDHVSGYSVIVFFPYRFDESGELQIESPFTTAGTYSIFGRPKTGTS